jgi:hypothetical protein
MAKSRSAQEVIENKYGIKLTVRENPLVSSLGTTSVQICLNNPRRMSLIVINLSANTVYVRPSFAASSSAGIVLSPNGGYLSLNAEDDYILQTLEWWGVASAASSAILVIESFIT